MAAKSIKRRPRLKPTSPAHKRSKSSASAKSPTIDTPKLSKCEQTSLSAFCDSVQLEEISFEFWNSRHSDLDLTVPLWLAKDQAIQGGDRMISFTRSVRSSQSASAQKQKATCHVSLPAGVEDGNRIHVKGQGDQGLEAYGDLIVIVHVKS